MQICTKDDDDDDDDDNDDSVHIIHIHHDGNPEEKLFIDDVRKETGAPGRFPRSALRAPGPARSSPGPEARTPPETQVVASSSCRLFFFCRRGDNLRMPPCNHLHL